MTTPCTACPPTTTDCESLPSALDNFIVQFFGSVTRVLGSDGKITWILPCDLDEGLAGYPRATNEGLACYFLRIAGEAMLGAAMGNGLCNVVAPFFQPSISGSVVVQVDNPSVLVVGEYVWSPDGGWYKVSSVSGVTATLENLFGAPYNAVGGTGIPVTRLAPCGPLDRWSDFAAAVADSALEAAKSYADTRDDAVQNSANSYTDSKSTSDRAYAAAQAASAQSAAQAFATAQATNAEEAANAYTDSKSVLDRDYADAVGIATETAANAHADSQDLSTLVQAQTYADDQDIIQQAAAQAYADSLQIVAVSEVRSAGTSAAYPGTIGPLVFGTTQAEVTLPVPGTYLLLALVHSHTGASSFVELKLRNSTDSSDVTPTYDFQFPLAGGDHSSIPLQAVVTVAAPKVIQIWGRLISGAASEAVSEQTLIQYVRLL